MQVASWDNVNRMDVRPGRGVVKVWLHNGYEVQVDLGTGQVLQVAYRRSDLIESIHDGSFFAGDWTKLGLFLPTGITLLLLWCGGIWMFWVPFWAKRKRAIARGWQQPAPRHNVVEIPMNILLWLVQLLLAAHSAWPGS